MNKTLNKVTRRKPKSNTFFKVAAIVVGAGILVGAALLAKDIMKSK